jgi:hypothetical protein
LATETLTHRSHVETLPEAGAIARAAPPMSVARIAVSWILLAALLGMQRWRIRDQRP